MYNDSLNKNSKSRLTVEEAQKQACKQNESDFDS